MKIKTVLFDLDDTIINSAHLYKDALLEAYRVFDLESPIKVDEKVFVDKYNQLAQSYYKRDPNSVASKSLLLRFQLISELFLGYVNANLILKMRDAFLSYVKRNISTVENSVELIKELKNKGIKIGIVSDGVLEFKLQKINESEIDRLADFLVTTEEAGMTKPSPTPFLIALRKANAAPHEALFIGNSEKTDIYGANELGIKTVLAHMNEKMEFEDLPDIEATYTVNNLLKVIDIIDYIEKN